MMRVFFVLTEPSLADPAWTTPVYEVKPGVKLKDATWPQDFITYNNPDELVRVANKLKADMAAEQVRYQTVAEVLSVLGVSQDEYMTKLKENKL